MKTLGLIVALALFCTGPVLAQTVERTPTDAVYVFMRSFVSIDGAGVCDTDESWRVEARLAHAPPEAWPLASRLNELRPRMMSALYPVIRGCLADDRRLGLGYARAERNARLALCVAINPHTLDFLSAGGVLDDVLDIVQPGWEKATAGLRCNGDPCPNGTVCDCRKSNPLDPEADCQKVAASCEHSEEPVRQIGGLTLSITW